MPGLGGWYSEYWWQWVLPEGHAHLSIPVLEFMAVLINMVVFGRLVIRGFHDQAFIVIYRRISFCDGAGIRSAQVTTDAVGVGSDLRTA